MARQKTPIDKFGGLAEVRRLLLAAGAPGSAGSSPYAMARELAATKGWSVRGSKKKILTRVMRELTGWVASPRPVRPRLRMVVATSVPKTRKEEFYASWEWTTLRMQVLKKYGRVCMCCGAKPGNGVVIHVDHIKPISKYWELRLDQNNLQVLCDTCNKGKGAWDETDYRSALAG